MPQFYRDYSVMEVAISLFHKSRAVSGVERAGLGDVIEVRPPLGEIGTLEREKFLWLRVFGLDTNRMFNFSVRYENEAEKYPYSIPLNRLKKMIPEFDIDAAKNPNLIYQPFFVIDEYFGKFVANTRSPLRAEGLIFNKDRMRYA